MERSLKSSKGVELKGQPVSWQEQPEFISVMAGAQLMGISEASIRRLLTLGKLKRFMLARGC